MMPALDRIAEWWLRRRRGAIALLAGNIGHGCDASDPTIDLLFEKAPFGCLVVDTGGRVLRANAAMRDLIGTAADLSSGAEARMIFADDAREAMWQDVTQLLRGRPAVIRNTPARISAAQGGAGDASAATVAVCVTVDAIAGRDGAVHGALLRIVDITLQTQLEAQLAHSQKLQAVGQLAGGIAHDFNNLLTAVLGGAESIALWPGIDADILEEANQIQSSAMRGAALVRQLLAFGRQQTLQPRSLAVNHVITDLSGLLRRLLGENIRLTLDLETPGRTVRADPTQLDQVLINLAVNARDAMQEGGELTLRSGHMTLYRPLTHGAETIPPGRYVMIEVVDTGTGIPADVLPRIFDPFFTTKRERGGTGLGLSTVHGIVRQSDGFLAVESEPGKGSRFRIYLPRWEEQDPVAIPRVPAEAVPPPPPEDTTRQRTLLLVEDEEPVRRLAERSFVRRGWRVLAAENGEAALALLDQETGRVTAVVTDMVMPGIDGAALLRAVRARPGMEDVAAVLVSGYAEEVLRRELETAQTAFLPKPYRPQELVARVEQVVAAARVSALV
ncbi:MAG: ATP-binding protein [Alphaproteobacteria bacterium]|nr:ATP-binding protein [Alphaproteobacteria bacterium]